MLLLNYLAKITFGPKWVSEEPDTENPGLSGSVSYPASLIATESTIFDLRGEQGLSSQIYMTSLTVLGSKTKGNLRKCSICKARGD